MRWRQFELFLLTSLLSCFPCDCLMKSSDFLCKTQNGMRYLPGQNGYCDQMDHSEQTETITLRVSGSWNDPTYFGGGVEYDNETGQILGMAGEIWDGLVRSRNILLNISEDLLSDETDDLGTKEDLVISGKADINMHFWDICCNRTDVMDPLLPLMPRTFYVTFKQPEVAYDIFLSQLTMKSWLATSLLILLFLIAMQIISYWQTSSDFWNLLDSVSWPIITLSQMSFEPEPKAWTRRLVMFPFGFFALVLFACFTANIVSTLQNARSIENAEDLADYQKFLVLIVGEENDPWLIRLKQSKGIATSKFIQRLERNENVKLYEKVSKMDKYKILDIAATGAASFILPDNALFETRDETDYNNPRTCQLTYYSLPSTQTSMSMWARKSLPKRVKRSLNLGLLRLWETGVWKRVKDRYKPSPPDCKNVEGNKTRRVSIEHTFLAFSLLAAGHAMALLILMIELICKKVDNKVKNKFY